MDLIILERNETGGRQGRSKAKQKRLPCIQCVLIWSSCILGNFLFPQTVGIQGVDIAFEMHGVPQPFLYH